MSVYIYKTFKCSRLNSRNHLRKNKLHSNFFYLFTLPKKKKKKEFIYVAGRMFGPLSNRIKIKDLQCFFYENLKNSLHSMGIHLFLLKKGLFMQKPNIFLCLKLVPIS